MSFILYKQMEKLLKSRYFSIFGWLNYFHPLVKLLTNQEKKILLGPFWGINKSQLKKYLCVFHYDEYKKKK